MPRRRVRRCLEVGGSDMRSTSLPKGSRARRLWAAEVDVLRGLTMEVRSKSDRAARTRRQIKMVDAQLTREFADLPEGRGTP